MNGFKQKPYLTLFSFEKNNSDLSNPIHSYTSGQL